MNVVIGRSQMRRGGNAVRAICTLSLFLLLLAAPQSRLAAQGQPPSPDPEASQAPTEPEAQAPAYDGDWWLSLGGREQYGFISGYEDCYVSEFRGSAAFTKEVQSYVDDLNKYFLGDPTRRKQTIGEALDAVRGAATDSPLPEAKANNPPPPNQAVYDGRFWFDADAAAQLGFVEGYLACHGAKLKDADGKFSKTPAKYVDLINKEYEITDDSDDINADKATIRVADVLHRLKDSETPPSNPAL
jgi:hypothetical protein